MADIIRMLFAGKLDPLDLPLRQNSAYRQTSQKVSAVLDLLYDKDESKDRLSDLLNELEMEIACAYFTLGYRWGGQMMLAMLREDDATFENDEEDKDHVDGERHDSL